MGRLIVNLIIILLFYEVLFAQRTGTTKTLSPDDLEVKIAALKEKIIENNDAASSFNLAKLLWGQDSYILRNKAYELAGNAVELDNNNLEYKYFYAEVCKSFSRFVSVRQWKNILAIDSTQIKALINMADFHAQEFLEWDKSARKTEIGLAFLQEWADKDLKEAFKYFEKALRIDSTNYNLCLKLSLLYEKINMPKLGTKHLKRLVKLNLADKDVYLALGLMNNQIKNLKESSENYEKAFSFMSQYERADYTFNSAIIFLEPELSKLSLTNTDSIKKYITDYWKTKDPLLKTDYNERLIEHYSRVAYANLYFSDLKRGFPGWKTDQGEIVIRYGEPANRIRLRPEPGKRKKDVWDYPEFSITFSDDYMNGRFSFEGNQLLFVEDKRRNSPTEYYPKFPGPLFDLDYKLYEFASLKKNETDIYCSYAINYSDWFTSKKKFAEGYDVSFFLFDNNFKKISQVDKTVIPDTSLCNYHYNCIQSTIIPNSGNVAFEMIRKNDNGVASYHGTYKTKQFSATDLDISNVLFASAIETEHSLPGSIQRGDYSILPNLSAKFSQGKPFYVYYEIYNLTTDADHLSNFEQTLTVSPKTKKPLFSAAINFLRPKEKENDISLTSNYKLPGKDQQMYLQLDMSKYEPGNYIITVTIKDKLSGKSVSGDSEIIWR